MRKWCFGRLEGLDLRFCFLLFLTFCLFSWVKNISIRKIFWIPCDHFFEIMVENDTGC